MQRIASYIAGLEGWRRSAAAAGAGTISALSLAPVFAWPVLFLTFPVLVFLLDGALTPAAQMATKSRLWRAAKIGWFFGFGYFLGGLYWIYAPFLVEPDQFLWAMPIAILGMPAMLAVFYAGACALAAGFWRRGGARIAALAIAFFLIEILRGHIFTGFPWNQPGYAFAAGPRLMQAASLIGVYGLTLLAFVIFASPAAWFAPTQSGPSRRPWLLPLCSMAILAGAGAWGAWRLAQAGDATVPDVRLRIVQGNIPQKEKWKPENRAWIVDRYLDLSRAPGPAATHVIWPESSVPLVPFMLDEELYAFTKEPALRRRFQEIIPIGGALILGAERASSEIRADGRRYLTKFYNSLYVMDGAANVTAVYDKTHLVPFGEYLPFPGFFRWLGFKQLTHHAQGFEAGRERPSLIAASAPPFTPLICYEIIFPGAAKARGADAKWLVNVTNDAWFGASSGPYQHLHQARIRAVEEGMPVVRAANTGVSAVIDSYGRIKAQIALGQTGAVDAALPAAAPPPLFARSGLWLLAPLGLFFALVYALLLKVD